MYWHERRKETRRQIRLQEKAQKAGCVELIDIIRKKPSWNKRFKTVQRLRAAQEVNE